jgi:hypothetical protein
MKFYIENTRIPVIKCQRPKFSDHSGRTWDSGKVMVNGNITEVFLDTTWGQYIYFQFGSDMSWYKVKMVSSSIDDLKNNTWNIDPFSVEPSKILTK